MTKAVFLNTGEPVLVDDEDYPVVSRYSWRRSSFKGYPMTTFKMTDDTEQTVYLHKLVMGMGCFGVCHHVNENVDDARKENLRRATYRENNIAKAKAPRKNGKPTSSKYKGVFFDKAIGKYRAGVMKDGKKHDLGSFDCEDAAGLAYNVKARELHGEFAWQNPVPELTWTRDTE